MKIINSTKLRQNINKVIAETDNRKLKGNPISKMISAATISTLQVLMRVIELSEERLIDDEFKDLKKEVHKMGVEIVRLKRKTVDL